LVSTLKEKFNKEIIKGEWFDFFDYRSIDNLYLIELKSRRCVVNQYSDTMVGLNKIKYARKVYPNFQCFFYLILRINYVCIKLIQKII